MKYIWSDKACNRILKRINYILPIAPQDDHVITLLVKVCSQVKYKGNET